MLYYAAATASAFTTAIDFFEITAPADAAVVLHSIELGQTTELGDAAEEVLGLSFIRGHTSSGSGGGTITPVPTETGAAAAGSTVERQNSTQASGGSPVTLAFLPWPLRAGFLWVPTPETRIVLSPSQRFVVAVTAPADSVTAHGTMVFEEIGG